MGQPLHEYSRRLIKRESAVRFYKIPFSFQPSERFVYLS